MSFSRGDALSGSPEGAKTGACHGTSNLRPAYHPAAILQLLPMTRALPVSQGSTVIQSCPDSSGQLKTQISVESRNLAYLRRRMHRPARASRLSVPVVGSGTEGVVNGILLAVMALPMLMPLKSKS